ncbi:MAG: hypothetical protein ACTSUV_01705 [Candidatus Ranarchaeia archaeon]
MKIQESYVLPTLINLLDTIYDFYKSIIRLGSTPLQGLLPIVPWFDIIFFGAPASVLILIVVGLRGRNDKVVHDKGSLVPVMESIASKENRDHLLEVIRVGVATSIKKLDDLRNESLITPYAYAALQGAFYEYQKNIVSVMKPFAASNEELNSNLSDLKRQESELENEIAQMQMQLKGDKTSSPTQPISPELTVINEELFSSDTKTDGDKLVGEMLSQIKNIADEFGIKDALDALPEE